MYGWTPEEQEPEVPAQEIAPRCPCGHVLKVQLEVVSGFLEYDLMHQERLDLNKPDYFVGELKYHNVGYCPACGYTQQVDPQAHEMVVDAWIRS